MEAKRGRRVSEMRTWPAVSFDTQSSKRSLNLAIRRPLVTFGSALSLEEWGWGQIAVD